MNSEVWVCITEEERCLPFTLASQGYDVWLGNNRGNKYSKKSTKFSPTSARFWNFSMDEFAFHDIPDTIDYILNTTSQPSLSYIGFSQGTAQAFATLSIHPGLNDKVNLFVALAPAMSPAGLSNGIVDSLVKASPDVLFLAFGRKSILSSATMWQSILYPPIFVRLIDMSLSFLFAWFGRNISVQQKLAAYPHLYSFTSTKSVVHWFQIIRNKSFQMYDDDGSNKFSVGASNRYYKVAKFPTRNIKTPIVLVYGGSDSLVDIRIMLKELPQHTIATEVPHFEHLDFLWAQEVDKLVFPHVLEALRFYSLGQNNDGIPKGLALSITDTAYLHRRQNSGSTTPWSEDDGGYSDYDGANDTPRTPKGKSFAQQQRDRHYQYQYNSRPATASPGQYHHLPNNSNSNPQLTWTEQFYKMPNKENPTPVVGSGAAAAAAPRKESVVSTSPDESEPPAESSSQPQPPIPIEDKGQDGTFGPAICNAREEDSPRNRSPSVAQQVQNRSHTAAGRDTDNESVASGRSSPSANSIALEAMTSRGIRVGSAKPSVGMG